MLIVISLIAVIFVFAIRKFPHKGHKIRYTFDKFVRLNRRLVSMSTFHNQTYRLVIQINKEGPEKYWVEVKNEKNPPLDEEEDFETDPEKEEPDFILDNSFYSQPEMLLPLLSITEVEDLVKEGTQNENMAYIYYYPRGLAQETAIHISRLDRPGSWTLYLDPVTKHLRVLKGQ